MNLLDLLEIQCLERPDAIAVHSPGAGESSYRALSDAADRAARDLAERGLGPGDRVAFLAENRLDLIPAWLAVLRLGGIAVPVNPAYRARELAHVLADAEPKLVITDPRGVTLLGELAPHGHSPTAEPLVLPLSASSAPLPRSLRGGNGSDPALLVYTSGTTGKSKGAVLTHDNLLATVTGLLAAWAWRPADVLLLTLPLFHVHGLVVGLFTALAAGARVELRRRFDAAAVARELAGGVDSGAAAPTLFFGVPTMYVRLASELGRLDDRSGLARMRLFASGSAPLAAETFHAFRELTGHAILERYGMSEAGMILSNPYAGPRLPGTVGTPLPGVSVRIVVPETAEDVAPGAPGELLVRGSNVFPGYWRDPETTAASFVADADGRRWFRTGDLGRCDPETGAVTLLGRRHELVLRGGYNVYPREVEEVLEGHPGVQEAAVAGRPDPEWGEVPVAWVVPTEAAPRAEEILAWCRERLAPFKVPAEIRVVEALPRNALGKVEKHRLAET